MKKILIAIVLITLVMTSAGFANKYAEQNGIELYEYNSTTQQTTKDIYAPTNILFKGQDVITDIPGIIANGRTLIPIYFVEEYLGAEVNWHQQSQTVEINYNGKNIMLPIGSEYATINGIQKELPSRVPAKLMYKIEQGEEIWRTMVPVRFLAENLGYEIGWVDDTKTVLVNSPEQDIIGLDLKYDINRQNFLELRLKTTGKVDANSYTIGDKDIDVNQKIIVDIPNANLKTEQFNENSYLKINNDAIDYEIGLYNVKNAKIKQTNDQMKNVRVELNLGEMKGYNTYYDEQTSELVIEFVNAINKVETQDIYNSKAVVINNDDENPMINQIWDEANNTLNIDFIHTVNKEKTNEFIEVFDGGIDTITTRRLTDNEKQQLGYDSFENATRVSIKVSDDKGFEDIYLDYEDDQVYAFVSGNPLDGFEYAKTDMANSQISINFLEEGQYTLDYNESSHTAQLRFEESLLDIEAIDLAIDDNIVKTIEIEKSSGYNIVTFELTENTIVDEESQSTATNNVLLTFKNQTIEDSEFRNTLIVIDPGHGGKDPGAHGTHLGLLEKDMNLAVGLSLKKKLEAQGFKVYITRDTDVYVGLYDRATIANELGADAFVSIHFNAHLNSDARGVEVLYAPDNTRDNYGFAVKAQNQLVRSLGRVDRGVVSRPNLVVIKETKMPAILAELGFLTNAEEERLINTNNYIDKAAEALMNGVVEQVK